MYIFKFDSIFMYYLFIIDTEYSYIFFNKYYYDVIDIFYKNKYVYFFIKKEKYNNIIFYFTNM